MFFLNYFLIKTSKWMVIRKIAFPKSIVVVCFNQLIYITYKKDDNSNDYIC